MNAPQQKEVSGSNAEAHIDGSLWLAVVAIAIAVLAYGTQHGNEKAVDLKQLQQDQKLAQQDQKIRDLETEVMLLRQDVTDLRVESQSKLQPRARPR